jgi:hypothetical protein
VDAQFSRPCFWRFQQDDSKRNVFAMVLPSLPLTNINNEGHKTIEQATLISKKKNIVKAKEAMLPLHQLSLTMFLVQSKILST